MPKAKKQKGALRALLRIIRLTLFGKLMCHSCSGSQQTGSLGQLKHGECALCLLRQ